jgi:hypothetical protein
MLLRTSLALGTLVVLASSAGAQARTVTVTTTDFAFSFPDTMQAGAITFEIVNHGAELHHMQIVRLEQGKTMADFGAAMQVQGPPPAWVTFLGGPQGGVPHGPATNATVTLTPGNYVALCFIPGPDGKPHIAKGMLKPFTVTGKAPAVAQAGAPKADYVMTLYDYNFDVDKPLKAGRRTILFRNTAQQFHEAFMVKLPPNVPVTALLEWMGSGMKGQPPVIPVGGIVAIGMGKENLVTMDLEPGNYGVYCFFPAPDGKEHVAHGMLKQISVTK